MRDYSNKEWQQQTNEFFEGVKTIVIGWMIVGSVVGLFYFSFPFHWG